MPRVQMRFCGPGPAQCLSLPNLQEYERTIRECLATADDVLELEQQVQVLSDAELRAKTDMFRQRLRDGWELDRVLVEAFAVVREVTDMLRMMCCSPAVGQARALASCQPLRTWL